MMNEGNTMDLDDLRAAWAQLDERVGRSLTKIEVVTNSLADSRARTLVRRSVWLPIVELVATLAGLCLVILGLQQGGSQVFISCLVSILILFTLLILSTIWQIAMVTTIQPAAPVIAMQRQLARVRTLRIFENKWMLLLSPVLWAPFLVVIVELFLKVVIGVEGSVFTAGFVYANLWIGAILSIALLWLSHRFSERLKGTSFLQNLLDEFAGRRLTEAREFLTRLDGFESEDL